MGKTVSVESMNDAVGGHKKTDDHILIFIYRDQDTSYGKIFRKTFNHIRRTILTEGPFERDEYGCLVNAERTVGLYAIKHLVIFTDSRSEFIISVNPDMVHFSGPRSQVQSFIEEASTLDADGRTANELLVLQRMLR